MLEAAPLGTGPWPLHTPGGIVSHPSTVALVLQGIVDGGNQPASSFKNLRICFSKQPIPISHGHAPASLSDENLKIVMILAPPGIAQEAESMAQLKNASQFSSWIGWVGVISVENAPE